jgi:hypothetical protein
VEHFVVRLWMPAPAAGDPIDADPGLRGVVSHVASGRSETFRDGRELLRRLIDMRGPVAIAADPLQERPASMP